MCVSCAGTWVVEYVRKVHASKSARCLNTDYVSTMHLGGGVHHVSKVPLY